MDAKQLAIKMLEYSDAQAKADELRDEIATAVLELQKSQTVGNVKATYYKGRKSYRYAEAWERDGEASDVDIELFTKVSYDYRKACKEAGIKEIPYSQATPSVSVKLV
ncbi:MAG: hypothetical protein GY832_28960 [Chloroflexi bacterium]|nr:hypothetical protein [Chloroflexota bacterium]